MKRGDSSTAYDVFISYSHHDKAVADAMCAALETDRVRCWIAPRDVLPGKEWSEGIIEGIDACRVFVLIFSSHADDSRQVRREVERAVDKGLIVIPFRIQDVPMSKSLEYFLSASHWLDAMTEPLERHLEKLRDTVNRLLDPPEARPTAAAPSSTARTDWAGAIAEGKYRCVYEDDFRSGRPDHAPRTDETVSVTAEPDGMGIHPGTDWTFNKYLGLLLDRPFAVEVASKKASGSDEYYYGIVLRDPDSPAFWGFLVSGIGTCACNEWRNGSAAPTTDKPVREFFASPIRTGDAENRLALIHEAGRFTFFVNERWAYDCEIHDLPTRFYLCFRCVFGVKTILSRVRHYRKIHSS